MKLLRSHLPIIFIVLLVACQPKEEELPPPNIIWINAEDIGPAFGAYGDEYAKTPPILMHWQKRA